MIQANELRIGNWFEFKGNYWQVSVIEKGKNDDKENPIPLTPEMLEKCGFVYLDYDVIIPPEKRMANITYKFPSPFYHKTLTIDCGIEVFLQNGIKVYLSLNEGNLDIDIKYIHQLQNLYFALTGEELEIHFHARKENSIS